MLRNVIDELSGIEVDGAIDVVFEKGTVAGAQMAVGFDNKFSIIFINTADADVAVGGDAVTVGVGNAVVAAGKQECPDRVGAPGQQPDIPPRLHFGNYRCQNVIKAIE